MTSVAPQPLIVVADVPAASRWYQQILGVSSGHRGEEYESFSPNDQLEPGRARVIAFQPSALAAPASRSLTALIHQSGSKRYSILS
jgi:hypothetical protein